MQSCNHAIMQGMQSLAFLLANGWCLVDLPITAHPPALPDSLTSAHAHLTPAQMGVVQVTKASLSLLPQQSTALRHLLSGSWGTMLSDRKPHLHPYPTPIPDPPSHADGRSGGDQGLAVLAAPAVFCAAPPAVRQLGHHAL